MTSRKKPAPAADLSTKLQTGFEASVDQARKILDDPATPPYVRIQTMNFFGKFQHLAGGGDTTMQDQFFALMKEIRETPHRIPSIEPDPGDGDVVELTDWSDGAVPQASA